MAMPMENGEALGDVESETLGLSGGLDDGVEDGQCPMKRLYGLRRECHPRTGRGRCI